MKNLSKAGVGVGAGVAGLALAKSGGAATLLTEARTLPAGSPRWAALERAFLTSGLP